MNIIIDNDRIAIREFVTDDWKSVFEFTSNYDCVKHMNWGPLDEKDTISFVEDAITNQNDSPRKVYNMLIEDKRSNKIVGGILLTLTSLENREASLGYCLNQDYWGLGYGSEAVVLMLKLAFETLTLHRVFALCDVNNQRSINLLERLNFTKEGLLREHQFCRKQWKTSAVFSMLEYEFKAMYSI